VGFWVTKKKTVGGVRGDHCLCPKTKGGKKEKSFHFWGTANRNKKKKSFSTGGDKKRGGGEGGGGATLQYPTTTKKKNKKGVGGDQRKLGGVEATRGSGKKGGVWVKFGWGTSTKNKR